MTLETYLKGLPAVERAASPDTRVGRLCADSRAVKPGDTFVAVRGLTVDGHDFIDQALKNGASLIFTQRPLPGDVPHVRFDGLSLAALSAKYYDYPAQKLIMTGVTGTNGKTTVTHIVYGILSRMGLKAGLIGTNNTARTTPDALELQAMLAGMVSDGCTHCVMEVSSHALEQGRVEHVRYKAAAFTNLTRDHLDFHGDMERYYQAKRKLFGHADAAVVNISDQYGIRLAGGIDCPCLTFSAAGGAALYASDIEMSHGSVGFTAVYDGNRARTEWRSPGRFSVENALAALGCGLMLGLGLEEQARLLPEIPPVKGRMEAAPYSDDFTVLIDYAHTPDGLENALLAVRGFAEGRIITVFGCGGDRDREKRPRMGEIATRLSDYTIVTSDNPRGEKPSDIISDIVAGCKARYTVTADRREAIGEALARAERGDVVLLCGKGHETYQEIGGVKYPMDEREIVREYRERSAGLRPPPRGKE
ncbi:MAG: UDP-N-acetylmuramoyl-L-alanyl-D-glutamate--2,6-diaminopimelate ligase [Oscillospiraceae bacterium]|nr:UDP-N-acetylmuramoyl-L-alanyl-D-glutamate--2,6-diaminopimelate ligase [Oscillospiraceae bacterium]